MRELLAGLILSVGIFLSQIYYGLIDPSKYKPGILSIAWPYLALIGLYALIEIVRAPLELDRERECTIAKYAKRFEHTFLGEITSLRLENPDNRRIDPPGRLSVSVTVSIRYLGEDTNMSVHSLQLWLVGCDRGSDINPRPWPIQGRFMEPRRFDFVFPSLPPSEIARARTAGSEWKVSFKDHLNSEYDSEIFTTTEPS